MPEGADFSWGIILKLNLGVSDAYIHYLRGYSKEEIFSLGAD